ncbi:MAG: zinc ribbon domain-containing protein, partial [Promethearchaeia archaeon]
RKLDGYGPNLQVHTISNGSIISGYQEIDSSVELSDIKSVNYTYSTDEGDSWIEIFSWERNTSKRFDEIDFETINYTWNTNGSDNRLDFESVLISVQAIDINGLDERTIYENIAIDNYKPEISEFLNIYDGIGNNFSEGDTNFTHHEEESIQFEFNSYDNNSASGTYAVLYMKNDSMENPLPLDWNSSSDEIVVNDSIPDGIYDFYINTTDGAGNWNKSDTISDIRIDNTRPEIGFEEPVDKDEIRNGTIISINDESGDLQYINFSYYIEDSGNQTYLGDINDPENGWSKEFEYDMEYENITIVANATDWAGLTGTAEVDVRVDNKRPEPELESPDLSEEKVGLTPQFNISLGLEQDNDTVWAAVEYDEQGRDDWYIAQNITLTDGNRTTNKNGTHYFLIFDEIDFSDEDSPVEHDWEELQFRIRVEDNQGWENPNRTLEFYEVPLYFEIPASTESFEAEIDGYTINLGWEPVEEAEYYRIYRSRVQYNVEEMNEANVGERLALLENQNSIAQLDETNNTYIDEINGPRTYYYLIVVLNEQGNPSEVKQIAVTIQLEEAQKSIQENPTAEWIYYFLGYLGIMGLFTVYGRRKVKKNWIKKRVKQKEVEIKEEQLASFEEEEFELDAKVAKEESAIMSTEEEPKYAKFEEEPEEEKDLITKCPSCGWVLSSGAEKCPRCGWKRP